MSVFLPPLSLPRLSDSGTLIGGSSSFGSSAGSISSRYATMRAAGMAAQGALTARTPRPPNQLEPIRREQKETHATPAPAASAAASNYPNGVDSSMSLETAASEELRLLNSGHAASAPVVEPDESTVLVVLPGYTGIDTLLGAIRGHGTIAIARDEKGKEKIRKIQFTPEQAHEFCKTEVDEAESDENNANEENQNADEGDDKAEDENQSVDADASDAQLSDDCMSPTFQSRLSVDSLLGGPAFAIELCGPSAVSALLAWVDDDQEQRAYIHVPTSAETAARDIHLLFTEFRAPTQTTLALIKPDAIASGFFAGIMSRIEEDGFEIQRMEEHIRFTEDQARAFYIEHASKPFYPLLVKFMSSGPLVALSLQRENAIPAWRKLIGSLNEPSSLRGLYATDGTRNAVHGSDSLESAEREIDLVFNQFIPATQITFALIKPDGMAHKDAILARLSESGFDLTRIQPVDRLTTEQVRLLFSSPIQWLQSTPPVEKSTPASLTGGSPMSPPRRAGAAVGISSPLSDQLPSPTAPTPERPNFDMLIEAMQKGPCIALELKRTQAVRTLREIAGGSHAYNMVDPNLAGPNSLRRLFGTSVLHNALYISSTIDDATRDSQLFFTHHKFYPPVSTTFLLIKPDAAIHAEAILSRLVQDGFRICRQKKLRLNATELTALFPAGVPSSASLFVGASSTVDSSSDEVDTFLTSGTCHAVQLKRPDAIEQLIRLVGSIDETVEGLKQSQPQSLRAVYGTSGVMDGLYAAASASEATRLIDLVFHSWYPEVQSTFGFIKPDAYGVKGAVDAILNRIRAEGFEVVRKSKVHLNVEQAKTFYAEHDGRIFQAGLIEFMTSGPALAIELKKVDAIRAWRTLLGPTDSNVAKKNAPNSLRALFGTDGRRNACHGSDSPESASRELDLVFGRFVPMIETTCCFLKPEALVSNVAKSMLKRIVAEGFEVVKQEKMTLTTQQAMRLYAEHAGALYFPELLKYMTSGPIIALALRKENAVAAFRALMGTTDSTVARRTQPNSLRALYGTDKKFNAVHGSESRDAAAREVDLAFNSFSVGVQDTFAWIKPDASEHEAEIVQRLVDEGFTIEKSVRRTLSIAQARQFYAEHAKAPFFDQLVKYMCSGPVVGMILRKENAVRALRELCGPTSSIEAKASDPDSLRALWGTDALRNALHSSKTPEAAVREIDQVFTHFFVGLQSTLALLKPDAIAKQAEGPILDMIKQAGFEVLRKKALSLTVDQARTFYAVHSHQPFFDGLVSFMTSGPVIALEIRKDDGVKAWRDLLGPTNSDKARQTAPGSIRALYGTDGRMNAAHGSDSEAAAKKECELIFDTFSSQLLTTLAIIKPDAVKKGHDDAIIKRITDAGFELIARKKLQLTMTQIRTLYLADVAKPFFKAASEFLASGPVICLALRKNAAITDLQNLVGPDNPKLAKKSHPSSIRAQFGTDVNRNAIHCPTSTASNAREVGLIFGEFNFDLLG